VSFPTLVSYACMYLEIIGISKLSFVWKSKYVMISEWLRRRLQDISQKYLSFYKARILISFTKIFTHSTMSMQSLHIYTHQYSRYIINQITILIISRRFSSNKSNERSFFCDSLEDIVSTHRPLVRLFSFHTWILESLWRLPNWASNKMSFTNFSAIILWSSLIFLSLAATLRPIASYSSSIINELLCDILRDGSVDSDSSDPRINDESFQSADCS